MCTGYALAQNSHVVVVLSTEKNVFKIGEPIVLTAELRNVGTVPIYVSQGIGFVDSAPAGIRIDFLDTAGHRFRPDSFADGIFGPARAKNPPRLLLAPGDFYGTRREALHLPKLPGTYKVIATYFDFTSDYATEEQKKESALLPYRILGGEHASNEVEIQIKP
jgi:hypothetical protein